MGKGGGGGGYDPGPQFEYDKELLDFNYEQAKDNEKRQEDIFAMQLWNRNQQLDFNDQERIDAWQHKADMATYDWNNQVAARIASEEAVGKQLYFNELAEEIGINDATRQYNDRLTAVGFENEGLLMDLTHTKKDVALQQAGVSISFKDSLGKSELQKEGLTLQQKGKRAELTSKATELGIESVRAAGQYAAMGQTGRSARKGMQSLMAQFSRQESVLLDIMENSESQYQNAFDSITQDQQTTVAQTNLKYKELASTIDKAEEKTLLGQRELKESMKSAQADWQSQKSSIALDKYGADLQAEASLAPEPSMPPQPKAPAKLPRPRSIEPAKVPSWDRIPKPKRGTAGSSAGALSNFLGAAGAAAGIVGTIATVAPYLGLSDDRLKYNINRVGNSKKGIPIYTFKYRFEGKHGPTYKGTSAQDLISMGRKDAVGTTEKDGFYYVDYSKLDVTMEVVTT